MKKSVFYFAAACLAFVGCSSQPTLVINGTTDSESEMVYLVSKRVAIDSAAVENGAFKFTVPVTDTTANLLYVTDNQTYQGMVFVEPGTATVENTGRTTKVTGTALNDKYQAYVDKSNELYASYRAADEDARKSINEQMEQLDADLFEQNVDNYIGLVALQDLQYNMDGDQLEAALAKLDPKFADNATVVSLSKKVDILKKTAIGQPYINVALEDRNGKVLSLSDYVGEGKYVLLDFWASWCGPCMGEIPYLVPAYEKFHKKGFEIFGVSLDSAKENWTKAIDENKMNWIHVSDLKYWQSEGAALYGVNAIPANYLIGPDGTIVAKDLRGQALAERLAEILK